MRWPLDTKDGLFFMFQSFDDAVGSRLSNQKSVSNPAAALMMGTVDDHDRSPESSELKSISEYQDTLICRKSQLLMKLHFFLSTNDGTTFIFVLAFKSQFPAPAVCA